MPIDPFNDGPLKEVPVDRRGDRRSSLRIVIHHYSHSEAGK